MNNKDVHFPGGKTELTKGRDGLLSFLRFIQKVKNGFDNSLTSDSRPSTN